MHEVLEKDEYGRYIVYVAEWRGAIGGSSSGVFARLDSAIFFVITGLGTDVDWSTFPKAELKYPYEDRNGSEGLEPVFRVTKRDSGCEGEVRRTAAMSTWIVGNGIAEVGKNWFLEATGRDLVTLSGSGDKLQGEV